MSKINKVNCQMSKIKKVNLDGAYLRSSSGHFWYIIDKINPRIMVHHGMMHQLVCQNVNSKKSDQD